MNKKILLDTINYLSKKQNPDEEDLKNEKSAWRQLIQMGVKKKEEIPERAKEKAVKKSKPESKSKENPDFKGTKSTVKTRKTTKKAANP